MRHSARRLAAPATSIVALGSVATSPALGETSITLRARLGLIPLEGGPQDCSATGHPLVPERHPRQSDAEG